MKAHCLPFTQIAHTSRLFTDFLAYSPQVGPFYPRTPFLREWVKDEAVRIAYDSDRRHRVAETLERQNKSWDCSAETLSNLNRLKNGAAALVTGQQVGLFGGPMFSIYKALTAVRLAAEATSAGVDCVPVFWLATYDHDLAEVNHVSTLGADGLLQTLSTASHGIEGAPVGTVPLGDEIAPVLEQAASALGETEITALLRETYGSGETLGSAFARLFTKLFSEWGVIVIDASDPELHRLAEPIYRSAIERSGELSAALLRRGEALESSNYHQQVKVTPSSVLLFTLQNGARVPIHRREESGGEEFLIDGATPEKISRPELLSRLSSAPEQFSPNVLLRPAVEDYLLPTLAYTGGAAETAYFAQAGSVYEILLGRVTPVIPRFSATVVEPKIQRLLEKHQITVPDALAGTEALRRRIAANSLPEDLHTAFDSAKESVDSDLAKLKEQLAPLDRTLLDAAETARSKMHHQLERLYTQATRAELQKGELVNRHAELLTQALYPEKGLQERTIGGMYFLARYGRELLHQLYDCIRSDCHDHQILEL